MTDSIRSFKNSPSDEQGEFCDIPERHAGHFSNHQDPGIVVDVEVKMDDPVDSQFIRAFMGEFEAASKKRSA